MTKATWLVPDRRSKVHFLCLLPSPPPTRSNHVSTACFGAIDRRVETGQAGWESRCRPPKVLVSRQATGCARGSTAPKPCLAAQTGGETVTFTVLWDNDGVLVDTEGLYFRATRAVLAKVSVDLTPDRFRAISLKRGESTFRLAAEREVSADRIAGLRAERDRLYAKSLAAHSCVVTGAEEVLQSLHGKVRMGVVTSSRRDHFEIAHSHGNLLRYFDFVLTREDYEYTKPIPSRTSRR